MAIPKIIHQTWKVKQVPRQYLPMIKSWKKNHPDWKYLFWTDDMNREFLEKHFPEFLETYDSYPYNIQRVDAVRYFILYKFGGMFVDLDFECLKNLEPLLHGNKCVFGLEPDDHSRRFGKSKIICNALMACEPDDQFFREICDTLKSYKSKSFVSLNLGTEVLESTGPFMLTQIYELSKLQSNVTLLPASMVYPLSLAESEARGDMVGNTNDYVKEKINAAFAVHYFWGTWWKHNN